MDPDHASVSAALVDRQERARREGQTRPGRTERMAFWAVLGPVPKCEAGETDVAALFHRKVLERLEAGGWTHSEYTHLWKLELLWRTRARGLDARFMIVGNVSGRLPRDVEARIKVLERSFRQG